MAQDIEEFLRMAAARKKQQAQQAQQGHQPPSPPPSAPAGRGSADSTPARARSDQRSREQRNRPQRPSRPSAPVSAPELYIGDEGVSEQQFYQGLEPTIKSSLSTDDIAEHTSHLGEQVLSRNQLVQSRVERKFDHEIGSLKRKQDEGPKTVSQGQGEEDVPDLSSIIRMVMSPNSARKAFILKEIFDSPKF